MLLPWLALLWHVLLTLLLGLAARQQQVRRIDVQAQLMHVLLTLLRWLLLPLPVLLVARR